MVKLVIIDDEVHICELVRSLIDWDALGITLAGMAHTGVEALELMEREKPEIVICDVRMPGYDGITLMQKAEALGLDARFIVISGYKQFEYARKGLQLGAVDYLLKPIDKDELHRALQKALQLFSDTDGVKQMSEALDNSRQALRAQFIRDISERRLPREAFSFEALRNNYALKIEGWVGAVCLHIDCGDPVDAGVFALARNKLAEALEDRARRCCNEEIVFADGNDVFALCAAAEDITRGYRDTFETLGRLVLALPEGVLSMGYTQQPDADNAADLLAQAQVAMKMHRFGAGTLLNPYQSGWQFAPPDAAQAQSVLDDINEALRSFSLGRLAPRLGDMLATARQQPGFGPPVWEALMHTVLGLANNAIGTLDEENRQYIDRLAAMDRLDRCPTLEAQAALCGRLIEEHLSLLLEKIQKEQNRPVRHVKHVVETRYMDPINLNEIADEVRLNPAYLSGLFKKETGQNFKDYLTEFRVNKAKELLRENNESVAVVAEMVGYKDTKYFSKLFAQMVGVNPSRYRKLHG